MKNCIVMLALALVMGATQAEAKTQVEEQVVTVGEFDKISTTGNIDVVYSQGNTHSVVIIGERRDIENVTAEVKGGKLMIEPKTEKKNVGGTSVRTSKIKSDIKVKVTSKDLKEVVITGSGDFDASTDVETTNLTLNIAGSGEMDFRKITAKATKLSIAGSGGVKVKQLDVENVNMSIAGSGEIEIDNVGKRCETAQFSVAGSGDVKAGFAGCNALKCSIAGSGEIELEGTVTDFTSSISGSGKIDRQELNITGKIRESDTRKKVDKLTS